MMEMLKRTTMPNGAAIEVVEQSKSTDPQLIVPNTVRINGQEILCPDGAFVRVHPMGSSEAVIVTVTMFAASLTVKHEDLPDD